MKYKITVEVEVDENDLSRLLWALRAFVQERHKDNYRADIGYITESRITYEQPSKISKAEKLATIANKMPLPL